MKTYTTHDGEQFTAENARDLVRQMRSRSPHPETNLAEWMAGVAKRVRQTNNSRVETSSEAAFVHGLIRAGMLTEGE